MRQRTTFLHNATAKFDPKELVVARDSLTVKSLDAAREDRLTFALPELPQELRTALTQTQHLHIRWASSQPYRTIGPHVSKITPGLHVFYTPRTEKKSESLCFLLQKVFGDGLRCDAAEETFILDAGSSESSSSIKSLQFYLLLPSLQEFVIYAKHKFCPSADQSCQSRVSALQSASYLDIDYDATSHQLTCAVFWDGAPESGVWNEKLTATAESVEVGVLAEEKATDPLELSLGGWLTVLGQDKKPKPTLFSFPSRHQPLADSSSNSYVTSFPPPTGLHPTMRISFPSSLSNPPADSCSLNAHLTLPSYLFADRYQLSDALFLASKNLASVRSISGETDLEAPDWALKAWGSTLLVEIAPPTTSSSVQGAFDAGIPLHLRYLTPNHNQSGLTGVPVPWPVVFWACDPATSHDQTGNPFDRVHLGYDRLFPQSTMFYHFNPQPASNGASLVETVRVPVLDLDRARWVEAGTVMTVTLGFAWVCRRLWGAATGAGRAKESMKERKKA